MIALCAAALPLPVFAASGAFLNPSDLDAWEGMTTDTQVETSAVEADMQFEDAKELFPKVETGTGAAQPESEFVMVRIDGRMMAFTDVPVREWFGPYVRAIAELGLISGYRDAQNVPLGLFGPADPVTLEQVTKVLLYATGTDPSACATGTGTLLNATATAWAKPFVFCAEQKQWSVFSDGSVQVTRNATRAEVIATVLQAFGIQTGNVSGDIFKDVGSATLYAAAIERAQNDGVVSGYTDASGEPTGFFGPDDTVKRAEFAKMITIALELYGKK